MLKCAGAVCLAIQLFMVPAAAADINVGILLSTTGPAAAIGNAERNGASFGATEIAGHKVNYLFLDEASDSTAAVAAMRKLFQGSNIDILVGPTTTPGSFAVIDPAVEYRLPVITLAPSMLWSRRSMRASAGSSRRPPTTITKRRRCSRT